MCSRVAGGWSVSQHALKERHRLVTSLSQPVETCQQIQTTPVTVNEYSVQQLVKIIPVIPASTWTHDMDQINDGNIIFYR